ncbi:MAG TPA: glycosyltransferase [Bacteroidales bacterium]|nr:glycosyltransferase [Bacteroidales bacterium]
MLNICIPVYNYNVNSLVKSLHEQCLNENIEFKILVFEDGSDLEFVEINKSVSNFLEVSHLINTTNIGRSAARNYLISQTEKGKILFIDCDSIVPDKNYIRNYINNFDKQIVCGGTIYEASQKQAGHELRYKYGINREMIIAKQRNINPNKAFATNNFMAAKEIFDKVCFREFLQKYGHEDSLFGYELKNNQIEIFHIDNPVIHNGVETNDVFLQKTEDGLKNLIIIENSQEIDKVFTKEIRIVNTYLQLKKYALNWFPLFFYKIFKNNIKKHLLVSKNPSLYLFDLYKFGYYCELKKLSV